MWDQYAKLKDLLVNKSKNDGRFFINFDDYIKYFSKTHICKVRDTYEYEYKTIEYNPDHIHNMVEISVKSSGKAFFIVNQKNKRMYQNLKGEKTFENQYCSFNLFLIKGAEFIFIDSIASNDNRLYIEYELKKPSTFIGVISFPINSEDHLNTNFVKFQNKQAQAEMFKSKNTKDSQKKIIKYIIGVYSNNKKTEIKEYNFTNKFTALLFKAPIIEWCTNDDAIIKKKVDINEKKTQENEQPNLEDYKDPKNKPLKHYFKDEGEPDSWRSIYFPKNYRGFGYIVIHNMSKGYIYEKLTFTKFKNVNLISLIDESDNKKLQLDDDMFMLNEEELEKENFNATIGLLNSRISVLQTFKKEIPISEENPLVLQLVVEPKDSVVILFEKTCETSGFELRSDIMFSYSMIELLRERAFVAKTTKIKYEKRFVEMYEKVIEHTNGIVFKYVNETNNMKLGVHISFTSMDNLRIQRRRLYDFRGNYIKNEDFQDLIRSSNNNYAKDTSEEEVVLPIIKDPTKETTLIVGPGEVVFVELICLNRYALFSYISDINYQVNYCREHNKGIYI